MLIRRPTQASFALLCILLAGCTNPAYRRPRYDSDEPFVRYDPREMIFEWQVPESYLAESGSKARLLFVGPNQHIIEEHDDLTASRWEGRRTRVVYFCRTISQEELDRLFDKGGKGTYSVFLIINRPGEPGWQVASDQFTLPR
jgi:hypothetical protein